MLKEVFVINGGILIFHYSSDQDKSDDDQAVLSSGLLTAIQDFSEHTRFDVLESFSTENEYFIFTKGSKEGQVIVGVFDRRAQRKLAEEALQKVRVIVDSTPWPLDLGRQLSSEMKESLRERIEIITSQIFGSEQLSAYVNEILSNRTDIPLGFVIDLENRETIASFARPKPLFRDAYAKELLLLHSTLETTLTRLELSESYSYFTVGSQDYVVAVCKSGKFLNIASGAMRTPEENVLTAVANMCYHPSVESLTDGIETETLETKGVLNSSGRIAIQEGKPLPTIANITISTLINNLDKFFRLLNRREFSIFEIITSGPDICRLKFEKEYENVSVKIWRCS